jgi:hypothetical protein
MVFIAQYNNILVDASDINCIKLSKFICCDPDCNDKLTYRKQHTRHYNKTTDTGELISCVSFVNAHFAHPSTNTNKCNIQKFISSIGNDDAIKFYRKWTEPFIIESFRSCFNSKSKMHILYKDIQIITSIKINKIDMIKERESYIHNNEKLIWILKINETRNTIIRRNYNNLITKYYILSSDDYYYDFELYDNDKSIVYLDFGKNQLVKLIKNTNYQGYEVELININDFINLFNKIIKSDYKIKIYEDINITSFNIHIDILTIMEKRLNNMMVKLTDFKNNIKYKVNHDNNKQYHKLYLNFK